MKKIGKYKITLTKLNVMIWGIAVIAIVIAAICFCHTAKTSSARVEVDDKIDITPTIITSMKEIGEWEFLSVNDEELVDTLKRGFLRDEKLVRIYYGKLSLGINMHDVSPRWIRQEGDSISITLPEIELLDRNFIDETRTRAFIETGNWTDADRDSLYHRAYEKMTRRCLTKENIETARENATIQFAKILKAMGIEKFSISWKDKGAGPF